MAFAPQQSSPKVPSPSPTPSQPKSSGFNEWIRTRSKWFWVCTIAVVWVIGIAIRAAQPPTDTNREAGHRAERALKAKGWDNKLPKPDEPKASSPEQPSQSSDK